MKQFCLLGALFVLGCAAANQMPASGKPDKDKEAAMSSRKDEEAVRAYFKAFAGAVTRGDYDTAIEMMTDDAVFWTAGYPAISGKPAMKAAYAALAAYTFHLDFDIEELQVCGEWAFVRGYENIALDPKDGKGKRVEIKNRRAISILRRQSNGSWKTARGMTNYDAPQPLAGGQ